MKTNKYAKDIWPIVKPVIYNARLTLIRQFSV